MLTAIGFVKPVTHSAIIITSITPGNVPVCVQSSAPVSHDDGDRRYLFCDVPDDDSSQLGAPLSNETVPGHERGSLQTVTGD